VFAKIRMPTKRTEIQRLCYAVLTENQIVNQVLIPITFILKVCQLSWCVGAMLN